MLVDTYDVLKSGVPNAIKVFKELKAAGHQRVGIRIDSGVFQLSKAARKMLDDAGLLKVKITASNALDEHVVASLLHEGAPLDNFGIGELDHQCLITCFEWRLQKPAAVIKDGQTIPKIKVSASREKLTLPGLKQVYRLYYPGTQNAFADVIALADESWTQPITVVKANPLATQREQRIERFDAVPLQVQALDGRKLQTTLPGVFDIQKYSQQMLAQIPAATKRLINPDEFPVYVTTKRAALQEKLGGGCR